MWPWICGGAVGFVFAYGVWRAGNASIAHKRDVATAPPLAANEQQKRNAWVAGLENSTKDESYEPQTVGRGVLRFADDAAASRFFSAPLDEGTSIAKGQCRYNVGVVEGRWGDMRALKDDSTNKIVCIRFEPALSIGVAQLAQ